MNKIILGLLILSAASAAHSAPASKEKRDYTKIDAVSAAVAIQTAENESTQAAYYVDAKENKKFMSDLLSDAASPLAKVARQIEIKNCGKNSTPKEPWIPGCGQVTLTKEVRTSFGRGGWESAGAGYTFFVGFTSEGSGRFFESTHTANIAETANALTNSQGQYTGVVVKTLKLDKISPLEKK